MSKSCGFLYKLLPQLLATVCVSVGSVGLGYDDGWASPAIPKMKQDGNFTASEEEFQWIASGTPLGTTIGSIFAFLITNKFGRQGTILRVSPFYFIGYLMSAYGFNSAIVLAGRIVIGFGHICNVMAAQIYASEISSPELRGILATIPSIFNLSGVLLSYVMGSFLGWRDMTLVGLAFPIAYLFMWFQPESPVWLLQNGHNTKAQESLQRLRGRKIEISDEYLRIKENCDKEAEKPKFHIREIFKKLFYKPVLLCIFMMFFQMFGGYGPIIFHSVEILTEVNSPLRGENASIILAAVMVAVAIMAAFIMDKAGRKVLLSISGFFLIAALCALGAFFYIKEFQGESAVASITWLPVASLFVYYGAYSLGYYEVPFILLGETFPVRYRDVMGSIGYFANSLFVFLSVKTYADLKHRVGYYGAYWFYAAVLLCGIIFVWIFMPETKGKTLEEIEMKMTRKKGQKTVASDAESGYGLIDGKEKQVVVAKL
ncbi:facilitated trehalose transporter Tret1-like isoform X2 [Artemia franciscana]|uniref:facilitated trehalose transporter Tret1-like isoform X2 n=1 Tax=Artemia franciscana TaxID=6661 RepID=UPI0032D9FD33